MFDETCLYDNKTIPNGYLIFLSTFAAALLSGVIRCDFFIPTVQVGMKKPAKRLETGCDVLVVIFWIIGRHAAFRGHALFHF